MAVDPIEEFAELLVRSYVDRKDIVARIRAFQFEARGEERSAFAKSLATAEVERGRLTVERQRLEAELWKRTAALATAEATIASLRAGMAVGVLAAREIAAQPGRADRELWLAWARFLDIPV